MTASSEAIRLGRYPRPIIPNGQLATLLFIGSETLLFASFISAYLVLRLSAPAWPPVGTPALTLDISVLNTVLLIFSAVTALLYTRAAGRRGRTAAQSWLFTTLALGCLFLALQYVEFQRLYARGLTLQINSYGGLFYSLSGLHALHILGGVGFLGYLLVAQVNTRERARNAVLYWCFVTAAWLILFSIQYLV